MTTAIRSRLARAMASLVVLCTATSALAQTAPLPGTDGKKPQVPATGGAKAGENPSKSPGSDGTPNAPLTGTDGTKPSVPAAVDGSKATGAPMAGDPAKCPVIGGPQRPVAERTTAAGGMTNRYWWPNQLNVGILHQNSPKGNPLGADFNYAGSSRSSTWWP